MKGARWKSWFILRINFVESIGDHETGERRNANKTLHKFTFKCLNDSHRELYVIAILFLKRSKNFFSHETDLKLETFSRVFHRVPFMIVNIIHRFSFTCDFKRASSVSKISNAIEKYLSGKKERFQCLRAIKRCAKNWTWKIVEGFSDFNENSKRQLNNW